VEDNLIKHSGLSFISSIIGAFIASLVVSLIAIKLSTDLPFKQLLITLFLTILCTVLFTVYIFRASQKLLSKIKLLDAASTEVVNTEFNNGKMFADLFRQEQERIITELLKTGEKMLQIGISAVHQKKIEGYFAGVYLIDQNDPTSLSLQFYYERNVHIGKNKKVKIGQYITGWALKEEKTLVRYFEQNWKEQADYVPLINNAFSTPLIHNKKIYGILTIGVRGRRVFWLPGKIIIRNIDYYPLKILSKKITYVLMHDHPHCMLSGRGWRDNGLVKEVRFILRHHSIHENEEVSSVSLVGSFNGWNIKINKMHKNYQNDWITSIGLPSGEYFYYFIVRYNNNREVCYLDENSPTKYIEGYQRVSIVTL
jgi:hypothetical protein